MGFELNVCTPATSAQATVTDTAIDFGAIKQRQQATWASGDFAVIGTTLQIVGESLAEAADVRADERVLDVAAGNGNATLAAARRFARVTSTDYVPHLLEKGAVRAKAEGLDVQFRAADAEALPFEDGSFDVALSTFGAMFAPDQDKTARELVRVVRGGGRIGMANWTPEGFIGQLFRVIAAHVPPPAGLRSPMLWGSEPRIVEQVEEAGGRATHRPRRAQPPRARRRRCLRGRRQCCRAEPRHRPGAGTDRHRHQSYHRCKNGIGQLEGGTP